MTAWCGGPQPPQNDFLPSGKLGVPEGDQVVALANELRKLPFDLVGFRCCTASLAVFLMQPVMSLLLLNAPLLAGCGHQGLAPGVACQLCNVAPRQAPDGRRRAGGRSETALVARGNSLHVPQRCICAVAVTFQHCVQGTPGAELAKGFVTKSTDFVIEKGTDKSTDSYSAL
jgi:hypothetical protein